MTMLVEKRTSPDVVRFWVVQEGASPEDRKDLSWVKVVIRCVWGSQHLMEAPLVQSFGTLSDRFSHRRARNAHIYPDDKC